MITLRRFYLLTLLIFFFVPLVRAQQGIKLSPSLGAGFPTSEFGDFGNTGLNVGLSADYQLSKNFALGLGVNNQSNKALMPFDYSAVPENVMNPLRESGGWSSTLIGVGPTYTIGNNHFLVDIYSKAGLALNRTPEVQQTFEVGDSDFDLFSMKKQRSAGFGLASGLRLQYLVSDALAVFINPQYLYSATKLDYSHRDLTEAMREGRVNVDMLREQPVVQEKISPNVLNVNAGISYQLSSSKKTPKEDRNEPALESEVISKEPIVANQGCRAVALSSPVDQQNIYMDRKAESNFKWAETGRTQPTDYMFRLKDQDGNTIYEKRTKRTEMTVSKDLESVLQRYASEEGTKVFWEVASNFKDCGTVSSDPHTTVLYSRSVGLIADFRDVQCEPDAYDSAGNVHYTGEVYLENPASNNTTISIPVQTFYTTTISNTNSINVDPSPTVNSTITLTPGQNTTVNFNFYRPFGETDAALHVEYYQDGNSALAVKEIALADLPSCICHICDRWDIVVTSSNLTKQGNADYNARAVTRFKIDHADPIQRVKADVISVKQYVNDTLCLSCTKQSKTMGMFNDGFMGNVTGWQNNGHATLFDENNDSYGNELTWTAASAQGVDFSTEKTFITDLNLPPFSTLECCEVVYEICIRFTFTDINCKTCDHVVCYKISSKTKPTDGGVLTPSYPSTKM